VLTLSRSSILRNLFASVLFVTSLAHAAADSDWQVRVWRGQGLGDSTLRAVTQTPDGFIWLASSYNCATFDGVQFERVFDTDLAGINQRMHCLLADRDGTLWLALEDGLVVHLQSTGARIFTNAPPRSTPRTLVQDGEGAIWVSYDHGNLCRIQNGITTQLSTGTTDEGEIVLATDCHGRLWFASLGRIGLFHDGKFDVLLHLTNRSTRMAAASDGSVWICSGLELLKYREGGQPKTCGTLKVANPGVRATAMIEDADGSVWIGTQTGGLFHYDGANFESIPASHRTINGLLQDHEGNIWAATGAGLTRVRPRAISIEGAEAGLPSEAVQSLCEDTNGTIWAGTKDASLVRRTEDGWQSVSPPAGADLGPVSRVAADPLGGIWVGTRRYNLHRWHDGVWTHWDRTNGLLSHTITALCADKAGETWVAGEQPTTLVCVQSNNVHLVQLPSGAGRIWAMTEDCRGAVWAAGENGTLLRIQNGVITDQSVKTTNSLAFRCILATDDGTVWLGSNRRGIGRLKNGELTFLTTARGLASDHISQIAADQQGWLWLGADEEIFKVRRDDLDAVAEGRSSSLKPVRVGQREGISTLHPTPDDWGGALGSRDGRVWMAMGPALAIIDPRKLHDDFTPPNVRVRRVLVDDQTLMQYRGTPPGKNTLGREPVILLPPSNHRLVFEFTALNFTAPENVRFLFQLEGIDNRWIEAGAQRSAGYSQLPPGRYRFRVRARSGAGIWSEQDASLALVVMPFLWQTWWFRSIVLLAFTAAIAGAARYLSHQRLKTRLRALQQQTAIERERSRIARDLHDDLGSRLTSVVLLNELTLQNRIPPEATHTHAQQISGTVREVIQSLDETVWALNPRNDSLPRMINYISQFAVDFAKLANLRCHVDLPAHPPALTVSVEARHNLFLALKEALNNAVRHGQPTEIRLSAAVTEASFVLTLEDDGRGFVVPSENSLGDGLRNMRSRMEEIGGRLDIASTPGSGTRITFTLAWRRA